MIEHTYEMMFDDDDRWLKIFTKTVPDPDYFKDCSVRINGKIYTEWTEEFKKECENRILIICLTI